MGKNGKIGIVHIRDTKNPLKLFYLQSMLKWINFKREKMLLLLVGYIFNSKSCYALPHVSRGQRALWLVKAALSQALSLYFPGVRPSCSPCEHLGQVMAAVAGAWPCQGARVCSPQCWHYQGEGQGSRPDSLKDTAFVSTSLRRWSFGRTVFLNFILSHL